MITHHSSGGQWEIITNHSEKHRSLQTVAKSKSLHMFEWFAKDAVGTLACLRLCLLSECWLETRHMLLQGE